MSLKTFFFKHALIGEDLELKNDVEIKVLDGYIDKIRTDVKSSPATKIKNCILIPGLINAHVHVGDSFAKELGYGKTLSEVVEPPNGLKHRLLSSVSEKDIINGMLLAFKEMIASGTILFADYREGGPDGVQIIKNALKKSPIKSIVLGRPHPKFNIDIVRTVLKLADGLGLSSINLYEDSQLELAFLFCKEAQKIISTHASETELERQHSLNNHGKSDIKRAIDAFHAEYLVHCIHADEEDLDYISRHDVAIGICPRANYYFGLNGPPIPKILERGITVCLGTDNVMASAPDLFREMEFLARHACRLHSPIPTIEILKMVTINPARVFRLDHILGCIKEMNRADFFLLDLTAPNLQPLKMENIHDFIVLRASSANVISTFINGEEVYGRGNFSF
ncbi:MAG: amidohydrolase family protein [Candidatus Helarchaeales archaeon]